LCVRETDAEFDKRIQHHLTISQIQSHFDDYAIAKLDKMFMCGDYGDPAAGRHTLDIYRYFRRINPEIVLGMNTNGAIQNAAWWQTLGEIFHRQRDYVVFSIDGLQDTNSVYRVNSNWSKLMANVQAYIAAGGSAHWDMLVYKHNQHQVDTCEKLARDMGFTWFRAKVSKRPLADKLEFPIGWARPSVNKGAIRCHALIEKSAYINAQGRLIPCCWLGNRQSNFVDDFEELKLTWKTKNPNPICYATCSTNKNKTIFQDQWQREIQIC
jgi:sulfatase maturation enzyme AslB (radical SAM superfamily)